ncbi:MAG: fasciclin domain-containing protein [Thermoanaerobaculia bacterium]|nr:fasciclin domain-containing protein [Thermoanaerobaculia bacterium]
MKNFLFVLLLTLGSGVLFTSCKEDGDGAQSVVDLAISNENLSILVDALQRADLATTLNGDGPFTVLAPTNAAFTALLNTLGVSSLNDIPVDQLRNILLNHVISGNVRSTDLATGYVATLATGPNNSPISLYVDITSGVKFNGTANVSTADIIGSNGVVHVIEQVITIPTVVNHALANPNFSTLVAALTRPDLGVDYVSVLSGNGPFTVFAPTNAAFAALLQELGASSLNDIPAATLNAVLQYHVVSGANVRASQLSNNQQVTTFQGGQFTVTLSDGAKIRDAKNRVANIIATDVQGGNGVVHAIDKVILP